MKLYRPVGLLELELIQKLDCKAFPPRLEIQPIFYPVLNEEYAIQIAKEWNTRDKASGYVGYVTQFEVDDEYVSKFERQIVGARMHEELWVPSEELDEFNSHIIGKIAVTKVFSSVEFVRDGASDEEWEKTVERYRQATWIYVDYFLCHYHCMHCDAELCSEHPDSCGDRFSHGYQIGGEASDHSKWSICPPCFTVLAENYGLKVG